ncbi:MAG: hypothetical protein AAF902_02065 [Chloroflexota bacterium]
MYAKYKARKDIPKWHIKKGDIVTLSANSYEDHKELFTPVKQQKAADKSEAEGKQDAS